MKLLPVLIALIIVNFVYAQRQVQLGSSVALSQFIVINTGTTDNLVSISKINNNLLISGFNTYLAKSYDNCNTLIPVNTPVFMDTPQNRYYRTLRLDTNNIYLSYKTTSSNWQFFKSINGGNTWVKKKDSTHFNLYYVEPALLFFDTIHSALIFDYNTALYTNNGLTTYTVGNWQSGWIGGVAVGSGAVISDSAAIFGEFLNGGAFITKNRGKTWQGTLVGGRPRDFEVVSKDTIYYISSPTATGVLGFFGYTFDGGVNWSYKTISDPTYFLNVCVKNKNEIYLLAREGYQAQGNAVILKTTDLGQTFTKFTTPFLNELYDMKFLNDSIALICGDNGLLFKWNTKTAIFVGVKENNINNDNTNIYPNPANEMLNVELKMLNVNEVYKIEIINTLGQVVYQSTITNPQSKINIEALSNGIYTIQIESKEKIIGRSKLVKQ